MKYQAYPEYKDSGVEWVDSIPNHWGKINIRWQAQLYAGGTPSKNIEEYWEEGTVPWINSGAVNQITVTEPSLYITEQAYKNSSAKWIPKDALVMALAGQGKTKGMVAKLAIDTTCNQSMAAIVPNKLSDSRYLFWWLTFNYQNIRNMAGGDLRDGLNLELLGNIGCPIPTDMEKDSIASFLDHETAKIDTLIEKQQQLIKLLKEKRQAVISHAVTKGLNPNAPMRDSGVEWLGEVPEHWDVKRIKHFGKIICGYAFKSNDFCESGIKTIKISNVSHLSFEWGDSSFLPNSFLFEKREYIPPKGSLIFAMTRPIISGGVKVAKFDLDEECLVNQRVGFLKPSQNINQDYLMYVAQSKSFFCAFDNNITTTNQPNISSEGIEDIRFSCPDLSEQTEIVRYIKTISNLFENTLNRVNEQIDLMQERRTALISAAVTGKIDVRNWVAPAYPCARDISASKHVTITENFGGMEASA